MTSRQTRNHRVLGRELWFYVIDDRKPPGAFESRTQISHLYSYPAWQSSLATQCYTTSRVDPQNSQENWLHWAGLSTSNLLPLFPPTSEAAILDYLCITAHIIFIHWLLSLIPTAFVDLLTCHPRLHGLLLPTGHSVNGWAHSDNDSRTCPPVTWRQNIVVLW